MALGKIFIILGALLSILGTYVFAIYGGTGYVGSGIGFITNLSILFENADSFAIALSIEVWMFFILVVIFLIFLAAGVLQIIGIKNKVVGLIFSLFPLGVGLMFILLVYSDFLGMKSAFFAIFFIGEHYGNFFPIFVPLGDLALGAYFLVGGGVLGVISTFLPRE